MSHKIACATALLLGWMALPVPAADSPSATPRPALKKTYLPLAEGHETGANALLIEPARMGPNSRIVMINSHPKNRNNFEYFVSDVFGERGYRVIEVNIYDEETSVEVLLPPIAAAIRIARKLPGVV